MKTTRKENTVTIEVGAKAVEKLAHYNTMKNETLAALVGAITEAWDDVWDNSCAQLKTMKGKLTSKATITANVALSGDILVLENGKVGIATKCEEDDGGAISRGGFEVEIPDINSDIRQEKLAL